MLNKLENSFNNFSIKVIVEIFLITAILFVCFFLYFKKNPTLSDQKNQAKYFKGDIYTVYSKINNIENINILNSKIEKNSIDLSINSTLEHLNFIINQIENLNSFIKINAIKITKDTQGYKMNLKINIGEYKEKKRVYQLPYIIETTSKEDVPKEEQMPKNIENKIEFKLSAIIFDTILINGEYLKLNEKIENFKLIKIGNKSILLQKNKEIIKVLLNE